MTVTCRCNAPMIQEGNYMVCSRGCGYRYEIVQRVPSQAELLEENQALRKIIEDIVEIDDTEHEAIVRAKKYLNE